MVQSKPQNPSFSQRVKSQKKEKHPKGSTQSGVIVTRETREIDSFEAKYRVELTLVKKRYNCRRKNGGTASAAKSVIPAMYAW